MKAYHLGSLANHLYLSKSVFLEEIERNESVYKKKTPKSHIKSNKKCKQSWLFLE